MPPEKFEILESVPFGYRILRHRYQGDNSWLVETIAWFARRDHAEAYVRLSNRGQDLGTIV